MSAADLWSEFITERLGCFSSTEARDQRQSEDNTSYFHEEVLIYVPPFLITTTTSWLGSGVLSFILEASNSWSLSTSLFLLFTVHLILLYLKESGCSGVDFPKYIQIL